MLAARAEGTPMAKQIYSVSTPISDSIIDANAVEAIRPVDDIAPDVRAAELAQAQQDYQFDWNTPNAPGVPLLKSLPMRDYFSIKWLANSGAAFVKIRLNEGLPPFHSDSDRARRLRDYADLFVVLDEPKVARDSLWATDESFGEQRLSGANPMSIRRARAAGDIAHLLPDGVEELLSGATVAQEIAAGRLFFVDHRGALAAIQSPATIELDGTSFTKYVPKVAALFWWNRWTERLMPISVSAEDLTQGPLASNGPSRKWVEAKFAFQAADGVVHEMSAHLGRTHLVMGAVAIAARRQLALSHPIHRLLMPHFRFMLAINQQAEKSLIAPNGDLAVSFGAPIAEVVGVATQAYRTWDFTAHALPNDIAARGVGAKAGLPTYAYRDDATLLWQAIAEYTAEYVDLYYSNDPAVRADGELGAWSREVGAPAPAGAAIAGFPALDSVEGLVFALTQIIFTCSAQHSAVNYTQDDYLGFHPNSSFAIWARSDLLAMLPPMGPAEGQISIVKQLTAFRYDRLGDYAGKFTRDERANAATRRFAARLEEVEAKIMEHESHRWQSYKYLLPSNIINSISI
jgi:arachidonate 15-lipoxygenase